jgi:glucosamine-6-phosphate isomerase
VLDEWVGLDENDEGSCRRSLYRNLFNPLNIDKENITCFDAKSPDLLNECQRVDHIINEWGGIDLIVLGIGMNGHLGFNEPGCNPDLCSLVIDLDEITKVVGEKYFPDKVVPHKGISLGMAQIMASRKVIVMANGEKKADIVQKVVESEISIQIPASLIRNHFNSCLFIDEKASRKLFANNPST